MSTEKDNSKKETGSKHVGYLVGTGSNGDLGTAKSDMTKMSEAYKIVEYPEDASKPGVGGTVFIPGKEYHDKVLEKPNIPAVEVEEKPFYEGAQKRIAELEASKPQTGAIVVIDLSSLPKFAEDVTSQDIIDMMSKQGFTSYSDTGLIRDGYHSFDELYECRHALFIALCHCNKVSSWKSRAHSDGTSMPGWFILGFRKNAGNQITFHLPERLWEQCDVQELEMAPEFDGHTTYDVLERLMAIR